MIMSYVSILSQRLKNLFLGKSPLLQLVEHLDVDDLMQIGLHGVFHSVLRMLDEHMPAFASMRVDQKTELATGANPVVLLYVRQAFARHTPSAPASSVHRKLSSNYRCKAGEESQNR